MARMNMDGMTAVITGSTRGIGKAIALAMAEHGANVVVSGRNEETCDAVAAEIEAAQGRTCAIGVAASIGSAEALEQLVERSRAAFGKIDALVCNAASAVYSGPMGEISDPQFVKLLQNNLMSTNRLIALVAPEMRARKTGSIIIMSSIGGMIGTATIGPYNITKAANFQLARNLAVEFGRDGVRVNCIAPGVIRTDFARALWEDEANTQRVVAATPLNRLGEVDDIAGAAVFLASDHARFITGQSIVVDGGALIKAPVAD